MGAAKLITKLHRFYAQRQVQDEGGGCGQHCERPQDEKHALALHCASSPQLGSLGSSPSTRMAARSLALRARGFSASSVSPARMGLLFKRCQAERSRNARFTKRSSSE